MINQDHLALFTTGLRSRRFKQGTGTLSRYIGTDAEEHCCLGVACIIAMENGLDLEYVDEDGQRWYLSDYAADYPEAPRSAGDYSQSASMPRKVFEWYGFTDDDPDIVMLCDHCGADGDDEDGRHENSAAEVNDTGDYTFDQIADAFDRTYGPNRE